MPARFITFEGIDGSGKSTALARVAEALADDGVAVWSTAEETPRHGAAIRASIERGDPPLATTFLFLADRAAHVMDIQQALASGQTVLCDRFMHSTLAYQAVTLEGHVDAPPAFLAAAHADWCPVPDQVLLFTADPAACVERTRGRGAAASRYEQVEFLSRVQARYEALAAAEPERFTVIDANVDAEAVAAAALAAVRRALP